MVNKYLFLAYSFVWLIFMLYAWNLSRRQDNLKRDLEEVRSKVAKSTPAPASGNSTS